MRLKRLEDEEHIIKTILQKTTISDGVDCKQVWLLNCWENKLKYIFFFRINQEKKSNIIRDLDLIKENIKKETSKLNTATTKEANLEKLLDSAKSRFTDLTNSVAKDLEKFDL